MVFPQAVDAEGHEVVHCVVGGGDGGEDCADCGERVSRVVLCRAVLVRESRGRLPLDSFADSGTVSKPKCVVRASSCFAWD